MDATGVHGAVALLGGQASVAKLLGVTPPSVNHWVSGVRKLPPDRCPAIERATDGRVTVEELRPDLAERWYRIPDPAWPHPKGRPLLDVAGTEAKVKEVGDAV